MMYRDPDHQLLDCTRSEPDTGGSLSYGVSVSLS